MVRPRFFYPWPNMALANMAFQSTMLAIEAQQVIALRLAKMAMGGPDVRGEAKLMVAEKVETAAKGGQMMMEAALGGKRDLGAGQVVKLYRRKVRANRRRLAP